MPQPEDAPNFDGATQWGQDLLEKIKAGVPLHGPPLSSQQQQTRLFDPGPPVDEPWMQRPEDWVNRGDVFFHGTDDPDFEEGIGPQEGDNFDWKNPSFTYDAHFGSFASAAERRGTNSYTPRESRMVPVRLTEQPGERLIPDDGQPERSHYPKRPTPPAAMYTNHHEDSGSISGVADPAALRTWADDVLEADQSGRSVGQVRKQMALRHGDISFVTPDNPEEYTVQGSMLGEVARGYWAALDGWGGRNGEDDVQLERVQYDTYGQRLNRTAQSYSEFTKPRY